MTTFSTLSFIPPQIGGKMEYNISLNNVLSNQMDPNKEVKITFPKMSFSSLEGANDEKMFFPWLDSRVHTKCTLGLGTRANFGSDQGGSTNFKSRMYYINVNQIPNAIRTDAGAYFSVKDSMPALNSLLIDMQNDLFARKNFPIPESSDNDLPLFVRVPFYTAKIENNFFYLVSDYPFPVVVDPENGNTDFNTLAVQEHWWTTCVLPPRCVFYDKLEPDIYISIGRGYQLLNQSDASKMSDFSIDKLQPYVVIPPEGRYQSKNSQGFFKDAHYRIIGNDEARKFFSFLPWVNSTEWGISLDPYSLILEVDEEKKVFSNGRPMNPAQGSFGIVGTFYLETKRHFFKFPINTSSSDDPLQDIRFIHISFESAFFVPSYFVRGKNDGSQQLVNANIIYTFDSIKDLDMFTSGKFYLNENDVRNLPFITTKAAQMDSYNVTIRVLGEDFNGNVGVLNGNNFFFQMKFEYD